MHDEIVFGKKKLLRAMPKFVKRRKKHLEKKMNIFDFTKHYWILWETYQKILDNIDKVNWEEIHKDLWNGYLNRVM